MRWGIGVLARRFRCEDAACARRIFAERFDADVLAPWSRRAGRLDRIVHSLALALGGRPAASFARRLMMPVSNDTLLRVGAIIQARDRPEVIAEAATSGAVFKNKQAVGLLVGLKIFHAGNFQLNIMPLRETSDDAPGTIPSS